MNGNVLQPKKITLIEVTIVILLMTSAYPSSAGFNEDFSDMSVDWVLYAHDHDINVSVPHSWTITNGVLGSFGSIGLNNQFNYACHRTNSEYGSWSYDIHQPEPNETYEFGFRISKFPEILETPETLVSVPYTFEPPSEDLHGIEGTFDPDPLHFQIVDGTNNGMSMSQYTTFGTWENIDNADLMAKDLTGVRHISIERTGLELIVKSMTPSLWKEA